MVDRLPGFPSPSLNPDALKAFLCALSGRTGLQVPFLEPTVILLKHWSSIQPEFGPLAADFQVHLARTPSPYTFSLFGTTREQRRTQRPVYTIPSDHCWMTPPEVESVGQALALDLRSIGRLHSIHLKMVSHDDTGGTDPADEMSGVRNL